MRNKLAIIGASYLQLPLVQKAKEMGLETHCFAWEEGAVCEGFCDYFYPISVLDKEGILELCRDIVVDGITTIATDIAVPTIAYVAEKLDLNSNSYKTALIATDKGLMRKHFELYDIKSPGFIVVKSFDKKILDQLTFPVIVKPVDRSGSRGINKVESPCHLEEKINKALEESFSQKVIIEEYIEGEEVSVESISWKGKHYVLAVTDKVTTGDPHFVELEHHQPSKMSPLILNKIKDLTMRSLNALNIEFGASHTEIKINDKGEPYVIEVGARMGGDFIGSHLVNLSTGYDYVKAVIDISLNKFKEPVLDKSLCSGVYFLCKDSEKVLPYFLKNNVFDVKKEIQNDVLKLVRNSNDRSGYLIYCSNTRPGLT